MFKVVKSKRNVTIFILILAISLICVSINYVFLKPTKVNFFIASKVYKAPANSAFTDDNFYKCVVDAYNSTNRTSIAYTVNLTDEQLSTITELDCDGFRKEETEKIKNTKGVEKLTKLYELILSVNNLDKIDISQNKLLVHLDVYDNQLKNLDLRTNTKLTYLRIDNNEISELDVSNSTELKTLRVHNNQCATLDVSNNVALESLGVSDNQLTSLDVSKNISLKYLDADGNQLSNIDLSSNAALQQLLINGNQLTSLDVSKNINLKVLEVSNNSLINLELSNNKVLTTLRVSSNFLTELDVSQNTVLTGLQVDKNQLTKLDISKNISLNYLGASVNNLTEIDISNNVLLYSLNISNNKLTSIDVSKNIYLDTLIVRNNNLTEIDVSNNGLLTTLYASDNQLIDIDVSKNTKLKWFEVYGNPFTFEIVKYKKNEMFLLTGGELKLPEGKKNTLISTTNQFNSNISGNSKVILSYKHDLYNNGFYEVEYDIYIIEATSNKYLINEEEGYIYTGIQIDEETILNNISLNYGEVSIEDNKLIIKYENEIVKEFDIVNIQSEKYDLTKDYIFEYEENNITINNGTINKNTENNILEIKYGENILEIYKLVEVTSEKYDFSNSTIRVQDNNINNFLQSINCINCDTKVYDGTKYITEGEFKENHTLRIMYDKDVLKEYNLTFPVSGISLNKESVRLGLDRKNTVQLEAIINPKNAENKNVSWTSSNEDVATVDSNGLVTSKGLGKATITVTTEDGGYTDIVEIEVVDIISYQITYKDGDNTYIEEYEEDEVVLLKDDLTKNGYTLIGWKLNDKEYKLDDEFIMGNEDITMEAVWKLVIPNIEKSSDYKVKDNLITGISLGTNVNDLDLGLDNFYTVKIYDKSDNEKLDGLIVTGDKVKIYLDEVLVSSYIVVVEGDVTGTGTSTISDVAKLYQYLKKKIDMEECYKEAGNVVDSDNEIKINDVAKLYQFIKKKIESLEG